MAGGIISKRNPRSSLAKASSGIRGLDEITFGGLPRGRPTLVAGGPGCGKTVLGLQFLARGALDYDEPGVFVSFEESAEELISNSGSLGFDLSSLISSKKLLIDQVRVRANEVIETGEYDLEGLFVRLNHSIDSIGAKRIVLDTIETIFSSFSNLYILRSELIRLFEWLKNKGVTAVVTGEQGERSITRSGLEEYVSDCVIFLDNRITNQLCTRRLRVVKYRGSLHGTNEYPFIINENGLSVLPITSVGLEGTASMDRVSSGIPDLDSMFGGKGYYRGSLVLVSGRAGTGKTSVASSFVKESCRRGERVLFVSLEESESQIVRNMKSIGIDLTAFLREGQLRIFASRPTTKGLEAHLVELHNIYDQFKPMAVVIDPITSLLSVGHSPEVKSMLARTTDFFKMNDVTTILTSLSHSTGPENSDTIISSLVDSWIKLDAIEADGEINRTLRIVKSRGMEHSNQVKEFLIESGGVRLRDAYVGEGGVLTGSSRYLQEARDNAELLRVGHEIERLRRSLAVQRKSMEAQLGAIKADYDNRLTETKKMLENEIERAEKIKQTRERVAELRNVRGKGAKRARRK